ncbi:MAG: sulfatase-like hydrolase/transferase [Candidatus Aminicenantales bacterium]
MNSAIHRREFLRRAGWSAAAAAWPPLFSRCRRAAAKPNIIYILTDDLGYGELGCYGQRKIRTPHIDRLAAEGIRFTQHYSGSPVCAPTRCTLLTGKHTGRAYIRDNDEMEERGDVWHDLSLEGQRPLLPGIVTIGTLLKDAGYATGAVRKWGLGGPTTSGHPNRQGFDFWYGYLCQRVAHNYYPPYLCWKAIRTVSDEKWELYNLENDLGETKNLASENPAVIKEIAKVMTESRTESALFPLVRQKGGG